MLQVSFSLGYRKVESECHTVVRMANSSMLARAPGRGAVAQARVHTYPVVKDFEAIEDHRLCSTRVRYRTRWMCSTLSEPKRLSMGASSKQFLYPLMNWTMLCRSSAAR